MQQQGVCHAVVFKAIVHAQAYGEDRPAIPLAVGYIASRKGENRTVTGLLVTESLHYQTHLCNQVSSLFPSGDSCVTKLVNSDLALLLIPTEHQLFLHLNIFKHMIWADGQLGAGMPARLTAAVCLRRRRLAAPYR